MLNDSNNEIKLYDDEHPQVALWYGFLNDVIGLASFSFFITALTSDKPQVIASLSITFLSVWAYSKGIATRVWRHIRRDERIKGTVRSNIGTIAGTYMFLASYLLLGLTAFGVVDIKSFESYSFADIERQLSLLLN